MGLGETARPRTGRTVLRTAVSVILIAAAFASMAAYWITIRAVLPWIGIRQAAAVSLGSNAVANSRPAGGALAALAGGLALLLHSDTFALRAGRAPQRPVAVAARPTSPERSGVSVTGPELCSGRAAGGSRPPP